MRITNTLFYTNAANDYQRNMQELFKVNTQLSSGRKIQNSFEDSGVYVDTMRLDYEVATLEQVKESSSKAETYANNTDKTLNQFSDALTQFKTKLIQAANSSHSTTSLNALADELEALKNHMVSLGNTSINGQYLFSGSAVTQKSLDAFGNYLGNDESVEALIGSGVKIPYNIDGKDLFLGKDSDYNKIISTNVKMLNQTKLHPEIMQGIDTDPIEEYITEASTIRDLVGDADGDPTNDPNTVFYLSGRRADGTTFKSRFDISSSSNVSDLLERIGKEFGNTPTNRVVDVNLNAHGQIEVKDLKKGNSLLEMQLFGAIDRDASAGTVGSAEQDDIDDLLSQTNVDIIEFTKSDFSNLATVSTVTSREDIYRDDTFYIGYPMRTPDGEFVKENTPLLDFMPSNVDEILVGGNSLAVDSTTTVQDLMDTIKNEYFPNPSTDTIRLENGQLVTDNNSTITLTTIDGVNVVAGFQMPDGMNYERRGFSKEGNQLSGNVSQVVISSNEYATDSTKLSDVAGKALDGERLRLDFTKLDGTKDSYVEINFDGTSSTFSVFNLDGTSSTYNIYNADGTEAKADDITYRQLSDIVQMVVSNKLPNNNNFNFEEYTDAVEASSSFVDAGLDYKGRLQIIDKQNSQTKIEFSMYDPETDTFADDTLEGSSLNFMSNNLVTTDEPRVDLFKDLDEMIKAVREGRFRMDGDSSDPRNIGIQNSIQRLDHILDHVTKRHTKIGSYSNALSQAKERSELLSVNVQTVRSEVIDVDIGEAYMKFNQLSNSYQAMLSTVAKINSMSLLNYM